MMLDSNQTFVTLLLRDGDACYLCHQTADPDDPLEIEHVKPRYAGGSDDLSNLALAHRSCNRTKGTSAVVR
jgi:5-methylcytosine-specific restriction endonuclease McrA